VRETPHFGARLASRNALRGPRTEPVVWTRKRRSTPDKNLAEQSGTLMAWVSA